jgi:micrococcal nuclease
MTLLLGTELQPFVTAYRRASLRRVIDADTLDVLVDLGFDVHVHARLRVLRRGLAPFDAWETRGEERDLGLLAKARAEEILASQELRILSAKGGSKGKYGRWLAEVWVCIDPDNDLWASLADVLQEEGHGST